MERTYLCVWDYTSASIIYTEIEYDYDSPESIAKSFGWDEDNIEAFISEYIDIDEDLCLDAEPIYKKLAIGNRVSGRTWIVPITKKDEKNLEKTVKTYAEMFGISQGSLIWMSNFDEYIVQ